MCGLIFSDQKCWEEFSAASYPPWFEKYLNYNLLDDSYCFEAIADKDIIEQTLKITFVA